MANLSASQIAAQAAMQHQSQQHARKRSQTIPSPVEGTYPTGRRRNGSPAGPAANAGMGAASMHGALHYQNGLPGGSTSAATTAANVAFPRSGMGSPSLSSSEQVPPLPEKEVKPKSEKSKMKLFSKPKHVGISKDKDQDRKDKPLYSPSKMSSFGTGPLPRLTSASTLSLADGVASGASSMYQSTNSSTATLTPITEKAGATEKEKHKHHFLSRQKHKLKDKDDHHNLPLSSAASNSKPIDPNAPQSLYSFASSTPSPASTSFAKSMSGLDLRHGGRALREKKKEEKANAAAAGGAGAGLDPSLREYEASIGGDWPGFSSQTTPTLYGPSMSSAMSTYTIGPSIYSDVSTNGALQGFGLAGMTLDDAWPYLKAKLLVIFENEDIIIPVEDLNRLVTAHIQRCVQTRTPTLLPDDLRDLLATGFSSLGQILRNIRDEQLIPNLVDMWLHVFTKILPYVQAVFLPLDLEFRGTGPIMSAAQAADFWGESPDNSAGGGSVGQVLDVRRIVLMSYRDSVILPRYDTLKTIFSRLSLESINGIAPSDGQPSPDLSRPGTAGGLEPNSASYNSQSSTLLNDSNASLGSRSRGLSNTSSSSHADTLLTPGSFSSAAAAAAASHNGHMDIGLDSTRVTETVGRMLQCVAVLASVQSGDEPQQMMEGLAKVLKLNWLGRGRTGRNRKGFVGARVARGIKV